MYVWADVPVSMEMIWDAEQDGWDGWYRLMKWLDYQLRRHLPGYERNGAELIGLDAPRGAAYWTLRFVAIA